MQVDDDAAIRELATAEDLSIGAVVLVGVYNWRKGPLWPSICALFAGKRQRFEHLGMRCTVAWWRDKPYLIGMREAA
jgi:hypothetical protein